jgi:hypothetical protein
MNLLGLLIKIRAFEADKFEKKTKDPDGQNRKGNSYTVLASPCNNSAWSARATSLLLRASLPLLQWRPATVVCR